MQGFGGEGKADQVVDPGATGGKNVLRCRAIGQQNDHRGSWTTGILAPDESGERQAVNGRHAEVGEHDIHGPVLQLAQRVGPVRRLVYLLSPIGGEREQKQLARKIAGAGDKKG